MTMSEYTIDKKFLEMLVMLIHQQNMQLAKIISEEEGLPYHLVCMYVPSTHQIKQMLGAYSSTSSSELS
jgi:hypothetical protein